MRGVYLPNTTNKEAISKRIVLILRQYYKNVNSEGYI